MADTATAEVNSSGNEAQESLQAESATAADNAPANGAETDGEAMVAKDDAEKTKEESEPADKESNSKPDRGEKDPPSTPDKKTGSGSSEKNEKTEETSNETEEEEKTQTDDPPAALPIVSSSKKSRPPYKYDPDKITLRFLFANRDGLTVTVECRPSDTVGEVKGALLSVWPEDLPDCSGGDRLRLVCMGKGILMPDTRTLQDFQIPVFKTHPTPVNVSVKPETDAVEAAKNGTDGTNRRSNSTGGVSGDNGEQTDQGCACIIL